MKPDSRFGDYLLFRKLSSSPLGDTFRAGRLQARAIDRVVLLHRFNGEGVDQEALTRDAGDGRVLDLLEAPHFANGLDQGVVEGVPYVAYDYLLGRTLKETLRQAEAKATQPGHGYLLALVHQISSSLGRAAGLRVDGVPLRHGFLIPELLLLSAEGRVYPLGFSHAPALARQESLRETFAAYLAPESRCGEEIPADDVYALAAILFESLFGKPPNPAKSTAEQVDQALFSTARQPVPGPVQDLLKSGLAARPRRPDHRGFHRALEKVLDSTEDTPSQFQLAFFLHRLFRDELEAEAVEMRDEKATHFDPVELEPENEAQNGSDNEPDERLAVPEELPGQADLVVAQGASRTSFGARPFLSGLAIALSLALFAGGVSQWLRRSPAVAETVVSTEPAAATTDLEVEARRLVARGAADLQDRLKSEYEPRLTKLREDVAEARVRQAERQRRRARAAAQPPPEATTTNVPAAGDGMAASSLSPADSVDPVDTVDTTASPATTPEPPEPSRDAAADPILTDPVRAEPEAALGTGSPEETTRDATGGAGNASPASPSEDPAAPTQTPGAPSEQPATSSQPPAPAALPVPKEAAAAADEPLDPPPAAAATEPDSTAAQYSPPRLLTPPEPKYPPAALRLGRTAKVQLRVLVDEEGRASETEVVSAPAGYGFEESAIAAAAGTRWEPARRAGEPTTGWATITIDFRL